MERYNEELLERERQKQEKIEKQKAAIMSSTRERDKRSRPNVNSFQHASQLSSSMEIPYLNSFDNKKEDEGNSNFHANKHSHYRGNSEASRLLTESINQSSAEKLIQQSPTNIISIK